MGLLSCGNRPPYSFLPHRNFLRISSAKHQALGIRLFSDRWTICKWQRRSSIILKTQYSDSLLEGDLGWSKLASEAPLFLAQPYESIRSIIPLHPPLEQRRFDTTSPRKSFFQYRVAWSTGSGHICHTNHVSKGILCTIGFQEYNKRKIHLLHHAK